jgi:ABC-type sugar transport system ATPase subunit
MSALVDFSEVSDAPALALRGISKRFGGVHALRGADLTIPEPGTVLALCGENGCGKSTMLRILAGQAKPDAGRIEMAGEEIDFSGPQAAIRRGIVSVTQETTLALDLTVAENIYLGHRMTRGRFGIDWKQTMAAAQELLSRLGLQLDPACPVRKLRPDQQQMVEIVRALSIEARILILDEPTSSLTDDEVDALLERVRRLRDSGVSTIFVSHRLKEVFRVADRIAVLRDGRMVTEGPAADFDRDSLVEAMVGARHEQLPDRSRRPSAAQPVLRVRELTVPQVLRNISLDVAPGEIVGLAGLVGAGRSELLETIFGLHRPSAGAVEVEGRPFASKGARDAIPRGVAFVPADRKLQGLLLGMSVRENLVMASTACRHRARRPRAREEMPVVADSMSKFRIKAHSPDVAVTTLSGGNQQKVVVGKWLATDPRVLLLDEPTRGVDVGAKTELHRLLMDAAEKGLAILVSSSETPELLTMCDRIGVMYRGEIRAVLSRSEATESAIAHYAGGHR